MATDEESLCKAEILKVVIQRMLNNRCLKGFRKWKDIIVTMQE